MKTIETILSENSETIVCFHIGRGGRFNNQGHLSYMGEGNINDYVNDLFTRHENEQAYHDHPNWDESKQDGTDCITNLITNKDWDILKSAYGIDFTDLGNEMYYDHNDNMRLPVDNDGTGRLDFDGPYNTVYCRRVRDLNENEISHIIAAGKGEGEYQGYYGLLANELAGVSEEEKTEE